MPIVCDMKNIQEELEEFVTHFAHLVEKTSIARSKISRDAGLEQSLVGKIATGKNKNPKIDTLLKVSSALQLYPSELLPPTWIKPQEAYPSNAINISYLTRGLKIALFQQEQKKNDEDKLDLNELAKLIVVIYDIIVDDPSYEDEALKKIAIASLKMIHP